MPPYAPFLTRNPGCCRHHHPAGHHRWHPGCTNSFLVHRSWKRGLLAPSTGLLPAPSRNPIAGAAGVAREPRVADGAPQAKAGARCIPLRLHTALRCLCKRPVPNHTRRGGIACPDALAWLRRQPREQVGEEALHLQQETVGSTTVVVYLFIMPASCAPAHRLI